MKSKVVAGVVAGLLGGVIFGMGMSMMSAPTADGRTIPMIDMVGKIVGQPNPVGGWLYHLFNSAIIGAIFGGLFGNKIGSWRSGLGWGVAYGMALWVIGGLILMPILLGMPAFAPLTNPMMHSVAWGSLMGHVMYGAATGLLLRWLYRREALVAQPTVSQERVGIR